MSDKIGVKEFFTLSNTIPIIDVRSPGEFETGHIPGAFNIPIFTNDERAVVGTIYKKDGKQAAIDKGLEIVGLKLKKFANSARKLAVKNTLLVHCWRGGMRSSSMAWLFEMAGIKTYLLNGGYKAFRNYGKSQFQKSVNLKILGGMTGSGKTDILHEIENLGEQIIDLEKIANHKGSAFGFLGQKPQPTNEQFENELIYKWLSFDLSKPIWVEDESHSIGSNWIPNELYEMMRKSPVFKVDLNKEYRINRLVNEYACFDKKELENCISKIGKRLGGQHVKSALESLKNDDLKRVADITLSYYDKSYNFGLSKRNEALIHHIAVDEDNPKENAKLLINYQK